MRTMLFSHDVWDLVDIGYQEPAKNPTSSRWTIFSKIVLVFWVNIEVYKDNIVVSGSSVINQTEYNTIQLYIYKRLGKMEVLRGKLEGEITSSNTPLFNLTITNNNTNNV